jgi:hypothetical protein
MEVLIKAPVSECADQFGTYRGEKRSNTGSIARLFNEDRCQIGGAGGHWGFNQYFLI